MNTPESFIGPQPETPRIRVVGERIMRVTMCQPENPQDIMARDGVRQDITGVRPMDEVKVQSIPNSSWESTMYATTRTAPRLDIGL